MNYQFNELPDYIAEMVRRPAPLGSSVIPSTTPVVSFGDPHVANVATLGINPSRNEFLRKSGQLLADSDRRLATIDSLGALDTASLSDQQVAQVVNECARYFQVAPYKRWFDPFDEVLTGGLGVSYYTGTACHLDLIQWATDPIWGKISSPAAKAELLSEGADFLAQQLQHENVKLVVVNGATVWKQLAALKLASFDDVSSLPYGKAQKKNTLRVGHGCGAKFVGWTLNLQSSRGVRHEDQMALATWLRESEGLQTDSLVSEGAFIDKTTVTSKAEFAATLLHWFTTSNTETIGDVKNYGGSSLIRLDLGAHVRVDLNADTKRSAVAAYLQSVREHGPDAMWSLIANKNGTFNKLDFASTDSPTPGWYCYLTPASSVAARI